MADAMSTQDAAAAFVGDPSLLPPALRADIGRVVAIERALGVRVLPKSETESPTRAGDGENNGGSQDNGFASRHRFLSRWTSGSSSPPVEKFSTASEVPPRHPFTLPLNKHNESAYSAARLS